MAVRRLSDPNGRPWEMTTEVEGRTIRRRYWTKLEATTAFAIIRADAARGEFVQPADARIKLATYAEQWLATRTVQPSTYASYEINLRLHVLPLLGERPLSSLRRSDIQKLVRDLQSSGLADRTVRHNARLLGMVLKEAVRDRKLVVSPFDKISLPEQHRRELALLTPDQLRGLFDAAGSPHRPLLMLGATAGLRQGELLGLTVGNLDFLRGVVRVRTQLLTRTGEGAILTDRLKTPASRRDVPIPPSICAVMAEHLAARRPAPDELVFLNGHGRPWRRSSVNDVVWKPALRRAGLPEGYGMHSLRHSYVAMLISENVHPAVIQARLGHRSIVETMDTYAHLIAGAHERTNAAIEAALSLAPPTLHAL